MDSGKVSGAAHEMAFPDPVADLAAAGATCFHAVVPVNEGGDPAGSSNRAGAFVCGTVPGSSTP